MAVNPTMTQLPTLMHNEAAETADVARKIASDNRAIIQATAGRLRELAPRLVVTNARGSSDHAGVFAKYLITTCTGIPVVSGAPSISSVYGRALDLEGAACLSISQSGQSPDIVRSAEAMKAAGAHAITLVNDTASPLAIGADSLVPLQAGPERSVAATKSYLASLINALWLVAEWTGDDVLQQHLAGLPDLLEQAWSMDWSAPLAELAEVRGLFSIGRGVGLGIANEVALKFKETCQIHAESFSAAECSHGPLALLGPEFPALVFAQADESEASVRALVTRMIDLGAPVYLAGIEMPGAVHLPVPKAHPLIQPLLAAQSFYRAVADLSLSRGLNPDQPPALKKVTETT